MEERREGAAGDLPVPAIAGCLDPASPRSDVAGSGVPAPFWHRREEKGRTPPKGKRQREGVRGPAGASTAVLLGPPHRWRVKAGRHISETERERAREREGRAPHLRDREGGSATASGRGGRSLGWGLPWERGRGEGEGAASEGRRVRGVGGWQAGPPVL